MERAAGPNSSAGPVGEVVAADQKDQQQPCRPVDQPAAAQICNLLSRPQHDPSGRRR